MHDADSERVIRPAGLLKYFHTASNEPLAKSYGLTEDELRRRDTAFILSSTSVDVFSPVYMEDEIEITTNLGGTHIKTEGQQLLEMIKGGVFDE